MGQLGGGEKVTRDQKIVVPPFAGLREQDSSTSSAEPRQRGERRGADTASNSHAERWDISNGADDHGECCAATASDRYAEDTSACTGSDGHGARWGASTSSEHHGQLGDGTCSESERLLG